MTNASHRRGRKHDKGETCVELSDLQPGDTVYAASHIYNDGSIPAVDTDALMAAPGTRGVIIETGHLEEAPQRSVYLVRFEDAELNLGPPTGCWPEELSVNRQ
jgi:nitrogen fixation protein NifZ